MTDKKTESNRLTDLVQRLRGPIKHPQQLLNASHEAADALEALENRVEELKVALKPFAASAIKYDKLAYDGDEATGIAIGFVRDARKVLEAANDGL
jgi:hypothetical protein